MRNSIVFMVVGLAIALGGCGKDEGKDSSKKATPEQETEKPEEAKAPEAKAPEAKPEAAVVKTVALKIESFGIEIDVPESWKGRQLNDNAYTMDIATVKAGGMSMLPTFSLIKQPMAPDKSREEARTCRSGKLVDKQEVGEGRYFYLCELDVGGQAMFSLEWVMTLKEGGLRCSASGPDIIAMHAACKSIREI